MRWRAGLLIALLVSAGLSIDFYRPAAAVSPERMETAYRSLTIDGYFDASDAEQLVLLALSDDLLITRPEAVYITERLTRHALTEVEAPVADPADGVWVQRGRRLLVQALRAGIGGTEYRRAMQQLVVLAMDPAIGLAERFRLLELLDRYRRVDPAVGTRDVLEGVALLLTNPEEARLDREQRRKLELLEKEFQVPVILDGRGEAPPDPKVVIPPFH